MALAGMSRTSREEGWVGLTAILTATTRFETGQVGTVLCTVDGRNDGGTLQWVKQVDLAGVMGGFVLVRQLRWLCQGLAAGSYLRHQLVANEQTFSHDSRRESSCALQTPDASLRFEDSCIHCQACQETVFPIRSRPPSAVPPTVVRVAEVRGSEEGDAKRERAWSFRPSSAVT